MAGDDYQILKGDYRIETAQLITPIYNTSKVASYFPIIRDLKAHSKSVRYFTQTDDRQYRYNMETDSALSHHGITPTDTPTPVISTNYHWGVDELARINDSKLPADGRLSIGRQTLIDAEETIALTGATVALNDVATTTVDTTGTNSVAATTAFNVTTHALAISTFEGMIGQLIDGLEEVVDPLAFVVNPDIYKKIRGLVNANTDLRTLNELNERMREINSASPGVIPSKFLTATVARAGPGKFTITAGSKNACLFNINPQYYRIHASPITTRSALHEIQGLHVQQLERWRTVFIKKEAIIYEDVVTT